MEGDTWSSVVVAFFLLGEAIGAGQGPGLKLMMRMMEGSPMMMV